MFANVVDMMVLPLSVLGKSGLVDMWTIMDVDVEFNGPDPGKARKPILVMRSAVPEPNCSCPTSC